MLNNIFNVIKKRIWWILGAAIVFAVVFVCIIQFVYNPKKETYSAEFDLRLPGGGVYPDKTELWLEDIIKIENLLDVKNESYVPEAMRTNEYAGVDIEKMIDEDDIKFSRNIKSLEDGTFSYTYTVEIHNKYFKNRNLARSFLKDVIQSPLEKAKSIAESMNYLERLYEYDTQLTYSEKISALTLQKDYILSIYNDIKQLYGGTYVPKGLDSTKSIDDYTRELINVFNDTEKEYINKEINEKYYFFDAERMLDNLNIDISLAQREIEKNNLLIDGQYEEMEKVIQKLPPEDAVKQITSFTNKISEYRTLNDTLEDNISQYEAQKNSILNYTEGAGKAEKEAFDSRLDDIRDNLEACTQTAREVNIATYNEKAEVNFANNNIKPKGGINVFVSIIIGAIAGFILSSAGAAVIDLSRNYSSARKNGESGDVKKDSESDDTAQD